MVGDGKEKGQMVINGICAAIYPVPFSQGVDRTSPCPLHGLSGHSKVLTLPHTVGAEGASQAGSGIWQSRKLPIGSCRTGSLLQHVPGPGPRVHVALCAFAGGGVSKR